MSLNFLLKTYSDEDEKPKKPKPKKDEISLAGVLQRQRVRLKKTKAARPASLFFSPSSITYNLCARARIVQLAGLTTLYNEIPTPQKQLMFDVGHKFHDIIQGYYWDCNMLEGDFKCIKCEKKFYARSPTICPFVKSHERRHLKFKEVVLKNEKYRISGRCDGYVWIETAKNKEEKHLQDIKSIANRLANDPPDKFCFEDLDVKGAKPDHIVQLNYYMWMSGVHKGHILYVSKQSNQIKSFYFEFDVLKLQPYLDQIWDIITKAEQIKAGNKIELPAPCSKKDCLCSELVL